jgi:hypothetical protein
MAGTIVGGAQTELTLSNLAEFEEAFRADPQNLTAMNAVASAPLTKVAVRSTTPPRSVRSPV